MKCKTCRQEFQPTRANQLYCSPRCRRQAQNRKASHKSGSKQIHKISSKVVREAVRMLAEGDSGYMIEMSDEVYLIKAAGESEIGIYVYTYRPGQPAKGNRVKEWTWQEYDEDTLVALIHSAIIDILIERPKIKIRKVTAQDDELEYSY